MSKIDNEKIYRGIVAISPELIEEAESPMTRKSRNAIRIKPSFRKIAGIAVAAALIAVLSITAVAVGPAVWHGLVHFFNNEDEVSKAASDNAAALGLDVAAYGAYDGMDYGENGRVKDFISANMKLQEKDDSKVFYQADSLSDLKEQWGSANWNLDWLEQHYAAVPESHVAIHQYPQDSKDAESVELIGEYMGENGQIFNLQYYYHPAWSASDSHHLVDGYEVAEYYETDDGVSVAIEMTTSKTGKSVFWVIFESGHSSFNMFGTQTSLDEIKDIVNSLNLSALCNNK